ncbi:MAG TPA: type II toxin-antitoxin system VapC family toxin [Caulobacteraceae bacterium]|nr:type II toxin-antitoxin system VapC family toxin [Caulobacteraceae bacterium]
MTSYLLDTNALLWVGLDDRQLRPTARQQLFDAQLFTSVISAAEISIKASIGKLPLPAPFDTDFGAALKTLLRRSDVELLPLEAPVIDHLRTLPLHHRDPFDRLIIAQALTRGLTLATRDRAFFAYDGLEILEV